MDEPLFWTQLQQVIHPYDYEAEVVQAQWEKLVQLAIAPSLPTELIIQTVCSVINHNHPTYFNERSPLNLPAITPNISLSQKQRLALELSLSNSPITLITGSPGSGKTRIATALANAVVNHQKRVLILTHHSAALAAFHGLPGYPFSLSPTQNYRNWLIEQLQQQLAQAQMDYLPLHLLPDRELAELRTRANLETWLPTIQTASQQELTERLQQKFPHLCEARTQLFAYRLRQLAPLLGENLNLSQLYERLSERGITELADYLVNSSQVPIIGTVSEFMQPQHQYLWQTPFDLVIVEEAHCLTWFELMLLAGLGQKLVLLGDAVSRHSHLQSSNRQTFFSRFPHSFDWLAENLLPNYRTFLPEQFRLHPDIAAPVYGTLYDGWIQTHRQRGYPYLPQLSDRLVWQDVPSLSLTEGNQIWEFLRSIGSFITQIGIITFETAHRDWLQAHCPQEFSHILIGTVAEWAGQERDIVIAVCVGQLEVEPEDLNVALTRGRDYLILFGDYDYWWQRGSPMRPLLARTELQRNRLVIMHES